MPSVGIKPSRAEPSSGFGLNELLEGGRGYNLLWSTNALSSTVECGIEHRASWMFRFCLCSALGWVTALLLKRGSGEAIEQWWIA